MKDYLVTFQACNPNLKARIDMEEKRYDTDTKHTIRMVNCENRFIAERNGWDVLFKLYRGTGKNDWFIYSVVEQP